MKRLIAIAAIVMLAGGSLYSQERKFVTPPGQVVAIRAGRLFDAKSGGLMNNQIIVIRGDRVADVGPNVQIPREAQVIDLTNATVLPGMIDAHVHVNTGGETPAQRAFVALANAQIDLQAGFTTVLDMDSRGGFNTVDLREAINSGVVQGPRMQVVGQSLNPRAGNYYPDNQSIRFLDSFTENKNVNSPWLARAAVREAKLHGVDWIKIYISQDFVGPVHMWKANATLVNSPSMTLEEVEAIVDEAHRLGLKVACHSYDGTAADSCLKAGVDAPNHLLQLDDGGVKILLQKNLPFEVTVDDLIALEKDDLQDTGGKTSRLKLAEQAFRKALAAHVPIVFGSGATSPVIPHGKQANEFSYFTKWGMTPTQALQSTYLTAAHMLNYGWENQIGSIEKGKFADVIAVAGNPLTDIAQMEHVKFVMKGGMVVRNDFLKESENGK